MCWDESRGEILWYKELMTISHIDLNCAGIYGDATTNEWAVITQHQEGATQSLFSTPTFEKPNPQRKKGPAKMEKKTEPSGRIWQKRSINFHSDLFRIYTQRSLPACLPGTYCITQHWIHQGDKKSLTLSNVFRLAILLALVDGYEIKKGRKVGNLRCWMDATQLSVVCPCCATLAMCRPI